MVWENAAGAGRLSVVAALCTLGACSLGGPSGVYVGKSDRVAALLQIVKSDGGHLNGRFEAVGLTTDGSIKDLSAEVTGVIDGQNIVINAEPTGLPFGKVTLSGTLQMGHLHLAGSGFGTPLTLELDRSDEKAFDDQAATLRAKGNEIVAARAKVTAALTLSNLAAGKYPQVQQAVIAVEAFNARVERALPKIAAINERYRFITERMRSGLARERSIYGGGRASVARGQFSGAIDQADGAANQLRISEEDGRRDLVNTANSVQQAKVNADGACADARAGRLGPVSLEAWNMACDNLARTGQNLSTELEKLRSGLAELDSVWATESAAQDQIEKAGDQAVN